MELVCCLKIVNMVLLQALTLLTLAAFALTEPTAHVFLIIGQSNSLGLNTEGHIPEDTTDPRILQTSCCKNGVAVNEGCRFIEGNDPLHHICDDWYVVSGNIGFGMTFARQLLAETPAEDFIVLVPAGIGGTGFVNGVWNAYNGTGFQQAVVRLASTFRILAEEFPQVTSSLDGFLWHQGEDDAFVNTTTYLFEDIIPMIRAWRDTTLIPQTSQDVPFVVGNLVPTWVQDPAQPQRLGVLGALQVLPQLVPFSGAAPSTGLVALPSDEAHFTAPSQRNFGGRYFAAWKAAQLNNPE